MAEQQSLRAVQNIKDVCMALADEASRPPSCFDPHDKNVVLMLQRLLGILQENREVLTNPMAEISFYPIRAILRQDWLGPAITEMIYRILTALCKYVWLRSPVPIGLDSERAQQSIIVAAYLLNPDRPVPDPSPAWRPPRPRGPITTFEEKSSSFRGAGMECLDHLYQVAARNGYVDPIVRMPVTGEVILFYLRAIKIDTDEYEDQVIYITALNNIMDYMTTEQIAATIPSIVSLLTTVVSAPSRRHYKVKIAAMECMEKCIIGCLGDVTWPVDASDRSHHRPKDWSEHTAERLGECFQVISTWELSLLESTGWRPELMQEILKFAEEVYTECECVMIENTQSAAKLVWMIMMATTHERDPRVANDAIEFLKSNPSSLPAIRSNFLTHVRNLTSVLNSGNERENTVILKTLQNSLLVLEPSNFIEPLLDAVESSYAVSLSKSDVSKALESSTPAVRHLETFDENKPIFLSDLKLKVASSKTVQSALIGTLKEVGQLWPDDSLRVLRERLEAQPDKTAPTLANVRLLWMTATVLSGTPGGTDPEDLVRYCFSVLSSAMEERTSYASIPGVASSAHLSLVCYALGEAALVQGTEFQPYLIDLVHPLFSMVGDMASLDVRNHAGVAISKIAKACGYESPTALALDHKDYLLDGINSQLNTLSITPATLPSLASLIFISGESILPYLDDVMTSVFTLMEKYHSYYRITEGILSVFAALTTVVEKHVEPKRIEYIGKKEDLVDLDSLVAELDRISKQPQFMNPEVRIEDWSQRRTELKENETLDGDSDDEDSDVEAEMKPPKQAKYESNAEANEEKEDALDEADDAVEKWEYPIAKPVYEMLEKVASSCDRLLTHETGEIRKATLQLITILTPYLSLNKERFLPLVHKTWPQVLSRTMDPETYVVEQSFECLGAFAKYSGDFVETRIQAALQNLLAVYGPMLARKLPPFSSEARKAVAFTQFLTAAVESNDHLPLAVLEPALIAARPALLRGEYHKLKKALMKEKGTEDLLWLVLLGDGQEGGENGGARAVYASASQPSLSQNGPKTLTN